MGRKALTPEDRLALAQKRGYSAQSTLDRQNQLSQTEQSLLAGATKDLHEHVGEIWHEFLAVKGLKMDASLQLEPVILKDFVEYYASSRYGRIGELPTVHSIATVWYRFVGYQNRITGSKLDRQLVNDVAAFIGVSLRQKLDLSTKKRDKYLSCAIVESSSYRGTNQALAYKELEWKEEALKLPVLRMASAKGVDQSKALTYAALWNQIVPLGYEIGYRDSLKIHAIRAGVANKIKDPEVRRKFLDQANTGVYNKSYESKIAKGYGFSMYSGVDAPTDNIETLQSMDHRRNSNAPNDLPAKEKAEFFQRPDVQHLNMLIAQATRDIDYKPAKHPARFKERQKLYSMKGSLLRSAKMLYREEWFSTSYDEEALRQVQLEDEDKIILAKLRQRGIFQLTRRFMPARDRIANAILAETDQSQAALQDIYSLCVDDNRVAYRPNELPVGGMCPREGCSKAMIDLVHTLAGFATANCHSRNIATHAASGVVAKMTGTTIANLILKN
ncbi:hypothetical protein V500_03389 [Pseudogymnoascus sp. VKM F-4518 (FW-2643)]|nr:hypothetical protein V500_03389 [Pseudogymnoascus sp. VKM F-4518 (FW-2643)]